MPKAAERLGNIQAPQGGRFPSSYRRLWCFSEEAKVLGERIMLLDIDCMVVKNPLSLWCAEGDFVGWQPITIWGKENRLGGGTWMLKTGKLTGLWDKFIQDPLKLVQETREMGWNGSDQAIMSRFLKNQPRWQRYCGIYGIQDKVMTWEIPPKNAIFVHFNGEDKPWDMNKLWIRAYFNYFRGIQ